jgi:1-acyl-sn-glycerol-3-phosphate acyltransferase
MLAHAACAALILRFVYPRVTAARRRVLMRWWSAKLLRILNVTAVAAGTPPAGDAGVMIAANHVAWLDIFLVSSVRPTRFVAKSEIRDWPVAGWIAERAGTLFIRRDQMRDMARIDAKVRDALAQGDCVGLFPEGITTEGDTLHKFHSSLFEPAVANGALVHPVAIRYEHPDGTLCRAVSFVGERTFMQSMGLIIRQRAVLARVSFAPPLETRAAARRDVARETERVIASLLGLEDARSWPERGADRRGAPR